MPKSAKRGVAFSFTQLTDLPLLSPVLGDLLGSGERSSEECMTIVNARVLEFCNAYLKGEGAFTAGEIY